MRKSIHLGIILILSGTITTSAQSNYIGSGVSLKFDGVIGTYINIGDSYNSLAFPISFEAWVKPTQYPPVWGGVLGCDNDASAYYGFWVRTSSSNELQVEFGDGFGSGYQFRRGMMTTTTIPLNTWTHIAVVCSSVTDIHFYFNGVEQNAVPTDGASSVTAITHSSGEGSIGGQFNIFATHSIAGEMDEVRLWNVARTQTEVRDYMCRKIDPATSGLIGYWIGDESYTSTTVDDQTVPAEDGTIYGSVTKQTSGAPIGDESSYSYTSNWNNVTVFEQDPSGDEAIAKNISGSPYGVHVYEVNSFPYDVAGLDTVPPFYFGVFCAPENSTPAYTLEYDYNSANGVVNSSDENSASIFRRDDGSVTTWSNANGSLDTTTNQVVKNNENNRGEYILDIHYLNQQVPFVASDNIICEKFCTDFEDLSSNNPTSWYWMFPGGAPSSSTDENPANICYNVPGIYDVTLITNGPGGADTFTVQQYMTVYATPAFPTITQIGYTLTSSYAQSYQWQFNTADIPGATFQSYNVTQSGVYGVVITDANGCQNSATTWVLIEGIDDLSIDQRFLLSPNPASEKITISNFNGDLSMIRISDISGKILRTTVASKADQNITIDISEMEEGIYFVEMIFLTATATKKLILQK